MTAPAVSTAPDASLYSEVTWFYARQMRWIDRGDAERWADTFTEDAVFHLPTRAEPMRGRAELVAGARAAHAASAAAGERRRHVARLIDVERREEGALRVRSSLVVHAVRAGGDSRVELVCAGEDTVVRDGGELRVRFRRVVLDET